MRKLEIEDAEIMKIALQQEIVRSDESRYDHRLHGVLLVSQGFSCYEVGSMLGHTSKTIETWINQFNVKGFAGLQDELKSGRPPALNETVISSINSDLRNNPRNFGYSQNLWDGKLLSHHIEKVYQVKLGVRQCQRLL
ncbi:MAG: helix-turn-helix domain-containing protein [Candidatus Methanoperedens sp.]|nr:helix-turn-helix domain-containing protein [Candidatus Methanoperedens sp.]